jgi:DNA polymerase III subunit gamma/tau
VPAPMPTITPTTPSPAPVPNEETASTELCDRWCVAMHRLDTAGAISGMVRELGWQAGVLALEEPGGTQRWTLQVESESLRADAQRDKLAAALSAELDLPVQLELRAGSPSDSAAKRETQARLARQARAEESIRTDPVVVELMSQFKGARFVPGSIKPLLNPEGSST